MTPKQQIQALLAQVPADATFEEIQNHLNSYGGLRHQSHASTWPRTSQKNRLSSSAHEHREGNQGAEAFAVWQNIVSI